MTAPSGNGFWKGLSVAFNTGAKNALQPGAIVQEMVALHVSISKDFTASVSTQIAALRKLLLSSKNETLFSAVVQVSFHFLFLWCFVCKPSLIMKGDLPLIVNVDSADIMATLIRLKEEIQNKTGKALRLSKSSLLFL